MKNVFKKTMAIIVLVTIIFTNMPLFVFAAYVDTTIPTVVITGISSNMVVKKGDTITLKVYFDDETALSSTYLTSSMISTNGFSADVSVSGTGSTRTVILANVQGTGSGKSVTIAAGAATDTSGNKSKAVITRTFTIEQVDTTIPTVVISKPDVNSVVSGGSVKYTVYFDDETAIGQIKFNSSYVSLNGFDASISVSGTGSSRTVTLSNIVDKSGDNYITVMAGAVVDTSNNSSKAVNSYTFAITNKQVADTTIPTVVISKPNPSSVISGETVKYTVYFDDETAIGQIKFNSDYVILNGFDASVSVSGTGSSRTVTLSNVVDKSGDNYITVKAGSVVDTSNNSSKAVNSSTFTITNKPVVDTTIPTVVISKPNPESIYVGETVKYTVYFDDETNMGKVNFNEDYVTLNGFSATKKVTGSGLTYVVTLSNIQSDKDSDNYIIVLSGAAEDAAGNKTKAVNSSKFTVLAKEVDDKDTIAPVVKIGRPSPSSIYSGGTVVYNVTFTDNVKVTSVNLTKDKIKLVGFTADVSVKVDGLKSAVITLKNVKGNVGSSKYITIDSGVALDQPGNRSAKVTSYKFAIVKKATATVVPTVTKYTNNCIDDLSLLGDINKEITYFASWLRAEKYTATHVQENNYVAEDERMTYMVEYFNGSTAPAPSVKFELKIPYRVIVEEINGGGKITKQTDEETVITWNMGTIPSYAASQGTGYCRLYVRVKFLQNEKLEKSNNISEVFYPTLVTTAGGNNSYSYMRQLFIDTTEGKTGIYKSYLTTMDTTNQVRPDDEITRAEFAKLLADSGILEVKVGSNEYKTFKDHESIPSYARDAVSALTKTDIIQAFPDGTFKPSNPILMEDAMQMIAQAARYISEQKLTVYKPVFIYTDALKGKDDKVSPKKDYIMELMRQNVVVKYESNPDSYALRKDVVAMVNSLTFRGPYVETLPENTLKFADIREDSVFFYNIVGASNSYKYNYDYRLWQQIVEIVK